MALMSPHSFRERILTYGEEGTGKSKMMKDIMQGCVGKAWIVDTDRAWERMIGTDDVGDYELVDVRSQAFLKEQHGIDAMVEVTEQFARAMDVDDWLVVDLISYAWNWAQQKWTDEVFEEGLDQFLLAHRRAQVEAGKKGGNALDSLHDWPAIGRIHDRITDAVINAPGHVYMTSMAQPLFEKDKDNSQLMANFGHLGMKPMARPTVRHAGHTTLFMSRTMDGGFAWSTAKDRERQRMQRTTWENGAKDYLQAIGGWKPAAVVRGQRESQG